MNTSPAVGHWSIVTVLPFTDYAKTPIEEFSVHARALMEAAHVYHRNAAHYYTPRRKGKK